MESAVSHKLSLIVIRSKVTVPDFILNSGIAHYLVELPIICVCFSIIIIWHVRHLEIFELVRLEDERELATRLEAVSYKNDAQEGRTIMISDSD